MRIYTDGGLDGIGSQWITPSEYNLTQLLGRDPLEFYRPHDRRTFGPLGTNSMALWDLLGKIYNKPVYELLGGNKGTPVPVYDASVYFSDQIPEYAQKYKDRFKAEIDMSLALGHRHLKVKVGRGYQWMETEEGYERDLEVLRTMRDYGGSDIMISVDANNGYDFDRAKKFISDTADLNLSFVEELFPENMRDCLELKKIIADNGWDILLADGEFIKNPEAMKPYIDSKAFDIYQGDMRQFGIEDILTEADWVNKQGLAVAPHNWGSLLGYIESLHVGASLPNFYAAEYNPLTSEMISTEEYVIENGMVNVPEAPGFGLGINEELFSNIEVIFDTGPSTGIET